MIFLNGLALALSVPSNLYNDTGFAWLNPCFIYRHAKVNWFGAAFLALIANIALPIIAIVYWFYKLCTVGRK
jgi:hypothetical protein